MNEFSYLICSIFLILGLLLYVKVGTELRDIKDLVRQSHSLNLTCVSNNKIFREK